MPLSGEEDAIHRNEWDVCRRQRRDHVEFSRRDVGFREEHLPVHHARLRVCAGRVCAFEIGSRRQRAPKIVRDLSVEEFQVTQHRLNKKQLGRDLLYNALSYAAKRT